MVADMWRKFFIISGVVLLLGAGIALSAALRNLRMTNQQNVLKQNVNRLAEQIEESVFSGYIKAVKLIADSDGARSFLKSFDRAQLESLEIAFEGVRQVLGASIVYLMDTQATVVAATYYVDDSGEIRTLFGKNYEFRPYFRRAMAGESCIYPAKGKTSEERGIYFSYPVILADTGMVAGVAVVKMGMEEIDSVLSSSAGTSMLIISDGIVFASSDPGLLYHDTQQISQETRERINAEEQFPGESIEQLPFSIDKPVTMISGRLSFVTKANVGSTGWSVAIVETVDPNYPFSDSVGQALLISTTGSIILMLTIFIFALVRNNKKLSEARAEAEAATRAKSVFLANMSHEIRTPLNGVIGMTDILLATQLSGEQKEYANVVKRSGEYLLTLINDVLDFSKIEAGKVELENISFDLRTTMEDTVEMLMPKAREKGLELINSVDPNVPSGVYGDPGRFRQIVVNLVGNAIKFTETGHVAVHTEKTHETEREATIKISVKDTGIGIPKGKQATLFSAFTQVDPSTTRKYGGTGLGLSICKQLTDLMKGKIEVESEEGKGSNFHFTVVMGKQPEGLAGRQEPMAPLQGVRVIAVDDNEVNRQLFIKLLEFWECEVDTAGSVKEGISKMREAAGEGRGYSAALVDMNMPEESGFDLARQVKADPVLRDCRLILVTSAPQRGNAAEAKNAGFAGYLTKPVRSRQLHDTVAIVIGKMKKEDGFPEHGRGIVTRYTAAEKRKKLAQVLLVEDNKINRIVAETILLKLGCGVDFAENGKESLEMLMEKKFDIVFMDCHMPEMDGFEATKRIRAGEAGAEAKEVPIVAMTANAMEGDREQCLGAGMNDYVAKPISVDSILHILEKWAAGGENEKA
jgi:signal transduction histidine kinase/CheY-like chemotaxis protein